MCYDSSQPCFGSEKRGNVTSTLRRKITPYAHLIAPACRVLEIGPLDRPILSKAEHPGLFYADTHDYEQLHRIYSQDPGVIWEMVTPIDYVIESTYAASLAGEEKFDFVIHSHVLEHIPELIFFFQDVAEILKPGGFMAMTIPDKRYGFDRPRTVTTFPELYDVFIRGPEALAARALDYELNLQESYNREDLWAGAPEPEKILREKNGRALGPALAAYESGRQGRFGGIHFHVFTPASFIELLADLVWAGLLPFRLELFYDTQPGRHEFNVVLARDQLMRDKDRPAARVEREKLLLLAARLAESARLTEAERLTEARP